jgi:hypothetical protein
MFHVYEPVFDVLLTIVSVAEDEVPWYNWILTFSGTSEEVHWIVYDLPRSQTSPPFGVTTVTVP